MEQQRSELAILAAQTAHLEDLTDMHEIDIDELERQIIDLLTDVQAVR